MDMVLELVNGVLGNDWVKYVTAVIAVFSAVSAVTPTPVPGSVWSKIYVAIDWLSLNIGKAKDKSVEK